MAVVRNFKFKSLSRAMPQEEVEGTYSIIEMDGEKFLQIDTYGKRSRQDKGKVSQSLRLPEETCRQLIDIFNSNF